MFLKRDFLLKNDTAKKLYHDFAAEMPIVDYHCHINPQEIYEDRKFDSITRIWLGGDHYKWRFIRSKLGNLIGMLTDSRSFLSYTRHEYFRRILCNLIGEWVENGEYPNDEKTLSKIVQDICYNNAERYFNI